MPFHSRVRAASSPPAFSPSAVTSTHIASHPITQKEHDDVKRLYKCWSETYGRLRLAEKNQSALRAALRDVQLRYTLAINSIMARLDAEEQSAKENNALALEMIQEKDSAVEALEAAKLDIDIHRTERDMLLTMVKNLQEDLRNREAAAPTPVRRVADYSNEEVEADPRIKNLIKERNDARREVLELSTEVQGFKQKSLEFKEFVNHHVEQIKAKDEQLESSKTELEKTKQKLIDTETAAIKLLAERNDLRTMLASVQNPMGTVQWTGSPMPHPAPAAVSSAPMLNYQIPYPFPQQGPFNGNGNGNVAAPATPPGVPSTLRQRTLSPGSPFSHMVPGGGSPSSHQASHPGSPMRRHAIGHQRTSSGPSSSPHQAIGSPLHRQASATPGVSFFAPALPGAKPGSPYGINAGLQMGQSPAKRKRQEE